MNERNKRTLALISVLAALALLLVFGGASVIAAPDAIITVCPPPGTGCDYTTIQEAINNASAGDEIRVAAGTYTETLDIAITVTLKGGYEAAGWTRNIVAYETIIDGGGSGSVVTFVPGSDGAILDGFTVTGGATSPGGDGGGINIRPNAGTQTISRCTITNNRSGGIGGGIVVAAGATPLISATRIISNEATLEWGGGLAAYGSAFPTLVNVLVAGNSAAAGVGGLALEESGGILMNVTVANNTAPGTAIPVLATHLASAQREWPTPKQAKVLSGSG